MGNLAKLFGREGTIVMSPDNPVNPARESWTLRKEVQREFLWLGRFVETGIYQGGGIAQAIALGFAEIHGIEYNHEFYEDAHERFCWTTKVMGSPIKPVFQTPEGTEIKISLRRACSSYKLPQVLDELEGAALVFLDAHGEESSPLLHELDALAARLSKHRHTIIIDDIDMIEDRIGWGRSISLDELAKAISKFGGYTGDRIDSKMRPKSQLLLRPGR